MPAPPNRPAPRWSIALLALAAVGLAGAAARSASAPATAGVTALASPAAPGSVCPNLAVGADGSVWLSWLEPLTSGGQALKASRLAADRWSPPITVAAGDSFAASAVDPPILIAPAPGRLACSYLWKHAGAMHAHDVRVVMSSDGGATWGAPVVPHADDTATEHGFVSLVADAGGARAVWLDGRGGAPTPDAPQGREEGSFDMVLRTATIGWDGARSAESVLDPRTCDCCPTTAAATSRGVVVAYRDRSAQEIRDISVVRSDGAAWSSAATVHVDGWKLSGCPVNGPSLDARGDAVALAWWTAARDSACVRLVLSSDGGRTFGAATRIDEGHPAGRVDVVALDDGGAMVSWLENTAGRSRVLARRVGSDGRAQAPRELASLTSSRFGATPRLARSGDRVIAAWVEPGPTPQLHLAAIRAR